MAEGPHEVGGVVVAGLSPTCSTDRPVLTSSWAMQEKDLVTIERMVLEDYISSGGPGERTLGRTALLEGMRSFLAAAVVEDWSVSDLEVREHGDVAIYSYLWSERGSHGGEALDLGGVSTDVLLFEGVRCRQMHHVNASVR